MEESRQALVELVGTADHTGCSVQHSLQFVGPRFRHTRQDCVAVVSVLCDAADEISVHRGPESPYVGLGRRKRKPPTSFVYDDKVGLATPSWIRVART